MSKFTEVMKKVGLLQEESSLPEDQLAQIRQHARQILAEDSRDEEAAGQDTDTLSIPAPDSLPVENLMTVEDVYREFAMDAMDCSIFKVDAFVKALPDNLPTDVKKQSVLGILKATGLDTAALLEDGRQRIEALGKASDSFTAETGNIVAEGTKEIEGLQQKIDEQKQRICDRKKLQENQTALLQEEMERIRRIVDFLA